MTRRKKKKDLKKRLLILLTMLRSLPAIKNLRRPHIIHRHLTSQEPTDNFRAAATCVSSCSSGPAALQGQEEGSVRKYSCKAEMNFCENTVGHFSYWCGLPCSKHWFKSLLWQIYTRNELLKLHQWKKSAQTRLRQTRIPVGRLLPLCD